MKYKNEAHQHIFTAYVALSPYKYSNRFLAAIFLLSAEKELWFRAKKAIEKKQIDFDRIPRTDLSSYGYALLQLAQDFYTGSQHVTLQDLGDPYLISDRTCMMIIQAIGICREGYDYIGTNRKFQSRKEVQDALREE